MLFEAEINGNAAEEVPSGAFGTKLIKCVGCGKEFTFTEKEAEWMREKFGQSFRMPKRCKNCRPMRVKVDKDAVTLTAQPLFLRGRDVKTYHPVVNTKRNKLTYM